MGLINQDNRNKQDLTNTRTPEDVMRRLAKNVQITTDEVKGLTVEVKGKVDGKEIISTINQSAETVTIDASKININGTISANGNFKVDTSGNLECNQAKLTNVDMESNYHKTTVTDYGMVTYSKSTDFLDYCSHINYDGAGFSKVIRNGSIVIFNDFAYIGSEDYDGDYRKIQGCIKLSYISNGSLMPETIKMYGKTGNITCVSLTQTSSADKKKNFEKLENALDIVKDVDIYKYNMIDEKDTDKKHVGFVIGNDFKYREEITSQTNKEAELYSMISVLWKAVQEQQKEIEELKKVIK